ncbi:MAG TPA: CusA/CzcA family heavy metal efflux RND transporter [Sulfuriferula sp.]|nr:CusA/CzcA family heavy metal efflux RND transporter [Sulfuriferula sp.]
MIARVIDWSLRHRWLVLLASIIIAIGGIFSARHVALDAIPDLSDVQVIVTTPYPGQSPQDVEDQVTYPLTSALLSVPGARAVRGVSMFGKSFIYIIFHDGTDPYWARSRVLEYLSQAASRLPAGVTPTLGPDASSVGWVFQYALVDRTGKRNTFELRALQDFFLKYELQSVPGVAEVATVGGAAKQFQIELDPNRIAAYGLSFERVAQALRNANQSGGGSVVEMAHAEYMVRAQGYVKTLADLRQVVVGQDAQGYPLRLDQVAHIHLGPEARRGVTDLDGKGEVVGGIVVMRYGQNALDTVAAVKARLNSLRAGLPPGVEVVVTYDRSKLIRRAIHNLREKLIVECLAVALVCLAFLFHWRSALVAVVTLPLGILAAFWVMQMQGINANIMSLGGIAIAVGAMVDAAMVMIENMHKHLERAAPHPDYWEVARTASVEVGPALFFSLLVIMVSFLPVFALSGQEGKLFAPLAYTKTYAMAAAAGLAITLTPILMGYFIRGRIRRETENPLNRWLLAAYRPLLLWALAHRRETLLIALLCLLSSAWPLVHLGSEFMPPLNEGDILYMPTTVPGISIDEAANLLQITDRLIRTVPEVERVFGKAGRADTATDPAPLSMLETTILLKPRAQWAPGVSIKDVIRKLDSAVHLPGLTNAWGYPIRTRIDMLSTGIRTVLGVKVTGPDLTGISEAAQNIEAALKDVPGTRSVFAERVASGRYIDIDIDRFQAARYGINPGDVKSWVESAIGGETVTTVIDGRSRYSINLRYPRAFRASLQAIAQARVVAPNGAHIPLGTLARLSVHDGPAEIKSENGRLIGYVFVDLATRDIGGYVKRANAAIAQRVKLAPGYAFAWSGQFSELARAKQKLTWVIPATLGLVLVLLYGYFRQLAKPLLILSVLPFALVGGFWLVYALGYQLSVAVAVGFIALAGVATEFGVVMLLYIDQALAALPAPVTVVTIRDAVIEGALTRIRPKMMTVAVIVAGLLPIMLSQGDGADMMKRIAAPLVGGMLSTPLISLFLLPVLYLSLRHRLPR